MIRPDHTFVGAGAPSARPCIDASATRGPTHQCTTASICHTTRHSLNVSVPYLPRTCLLLHVATAPPASLISNSHSSAMQAHTNMPPYIDITKRMCLHKYVRPNPTLQKIKQKTTNTESKHSTINKNGTHRAAPPNYSITFTSSHHTLVTLTNSQNKLTTTQHTATHYNVRQKIPPKVKTHAYFLVPSIWDDQTYTFQTLPSSWFLVFLFPSPPYSTRVSRTNPTPRINVSCYSFPFSFNIIFLSIVFHPMTFIHTRFTIPAPLVEPFVAG